MDVQKTIEFLLGTQARHDGQIAEMREEGRRSHAQHASEIAEIREAQKLSHAQHASEITEIRDLLGQTAKLVAGIAQLTDQHHGRIRDLERGPA
jgi:hypothetical protein